MSTNKTVRHTAVPESNTEVANKEVADKQVRTPRGTASAYETTRHDELQENCKTSSQKFKYEINDCSPDYRISKHTVSTANTECGNESESVTGLTEIQQQFMLKFCRQLVSVIGACEQSESAEIEIGRRQINTSNIKVKLQAEREVTLNSKKL